MSKPIVVKGKDMKKCNTCKQEKKATAFYKLSKSKDGLNGQCKKCYNARILKWRKDNPDKYATFKKNWRANNPDKVNAMQSRADKNNSTNLTDGYVRKKIAQDIEGLKHSDIPDVMVELKREEIKSERLIKSKRNESNK